MTLVRLIPKGFRAGASHCGIKKPGTLDLAAIVSDRDCTAAGVFTTNIFKAAPVVVDQEMLKHNGGRGVRAVLVNSGCANAVTGRQGLKVAREMAAAAAENAGCAGKLGDGALVMSTGVIGQVPPGERIIAGVKPLFGQLQDSYDGWALAAKGIMTTDTFPKMVTGEFKVGESTYRLAGIAKGAGMIAPNMATLLGVAATDAKVSPQALNAALKYAVDRSFNSISVDGDMSTNDTILALANGAAAPESEPEIEVGGPGFESFQEALTTVATDLAKLVVRDGEGATKFVTVSVRGADNTADARKVAASVANSLLVKTALFGRDANWGRVLCAVGYAGVAVIPEKTSVSLIAADKSEPLALLVNGEPEKVDEDRALVMLSERDVNILIDLNMGSADADFWTCDLTYDYVKINGEYRS